MHSNKNFIQAVAELIVSTILKIHPIWIKLPKNIERSNKDWMKSFKQKAINSDCEHYNQCNNFGSSKNTGGKLCCIYCPHLSDGIDASTMERYNQIVIDTRNDILKSEKVEFLQNSNMNSLPNVIEIGTNIDEFIWNLKDSYVSAPPDIPSLGKKKEDEPEDQKIITYRLIFKDPDMRNEELGEVKENQALRMFESWAEMKEYSFSLYRVIDGKQDDKPIKSFDHTKNSDPEDVDTSEDDEKPSDDNDAEKAFAKKAQQGRSTPVWGVVFYGSDEEIEVQARTNDLCEALRLIVEKTNQKKIRVIPRFGSRVDDLNWKEILEKPASNRRFEPERIPVILRKLGFDFDIEEEIVTETEIPDLTRRYVTHQPDSSHRNFIGDVDGITEEVAKVKAATVARNIFEETILSIAGTNSELIEIARFDSKGYEITGSEEVNTGNDPEPFPPVDDEGIDLPDDNQDNDFSSPKLITVGSKKQIKQGRPPSSWEIKIGNKYVCSCIEVSTADICSICANLQKAFPGEKIVLIQCRKDMTRPEFDWEDKLSQYQVKIKVDPENVRSLLQETGLIKDLSSVTSSPSPKKERDLREKYWEIRFPDGKTWEFKEDDNYFALEITYRIVKKLELNSKDVSLNMILGSSEREVNWQADHLSIIGATSRKIEQASYSIDKVVNSSQPVIDFLAEKQKEDEKRREEFQREKEEDAKLSLELQAQVDPADADAIENMPDLIRLGRFFGLDVGRMIRLKKQGAEFETPNGLILAMVPVKKVDANKKQPRKEFEKMALRFLAKSMVSKDKKYAGNHTPILVTERDGRFFLIEGERRTRSANKNGSEMILALICPPMVDDEVLFQSCLANFSRQEMTLVEKANAYQMIMDAKDLNRSKLAEVVGMTPGHISNVLKVFKVNKRILKKLNERVIKPGTALYFGSYDKAHQWDMYQKLQRQIEVENLSANELKKLVREVAEDAGYNPIDKRAKTATQTKLSEFRRIVTSFNRLCADINGLSVEKIQEIDPAVMRTMKFKLAGTVEDAINMFARLSSLTGGGNISAASGERMKETLESILDDIS